MKTIIKLIVVALLANALWHVGSVYLAYYKFEDAVHAAAMEGGKADDSLRRKITELAMTYEMPLTGEAVTIHREQNHTSVEASFTRRIAVLPGFEVAWPFNLRVDAYVLSPARRVDLLKP